MQMGQDRPGLAMLTRDQLVETAATA